MIENNICLRDFANIPIAEDSSLAVFTNEDDMLYGGEPLFTVSDPGYIFQFATEEILSAKVVGIGAYTDDVCILIDGVTQNDNELSE